jgi:hypothetical protein
MGQYYNANTRAQAPTARLIAARIALLNTSSALRGSGGAQTQTVTSLASNATAPPISLSIGTLILLASRRGRPWGVPVVPSANTGQGFGIVGAEPFPRVPPPCVQKRLGGELRLASLAAVSPRSP